ncbi:protein argonaute 2-like isoform X2 [Nymphaea colorata]|nr:protein argonaute 2-like isoform X2 [Nymphaea colorata]
MESQWRGGRGGRRGRGGGADGEFNGGGRGGRGGELNLGRGGRGGSCSSGGRGGGGFNGGREGRSSSSEGSWERRGRDSVEGRRGAGGNFDGERRGGMRGGFSRGGALGRGGGGNFVGGSSGGGDAWGKGGGDFFGEKGGGAGGSGAGGSSAGSAASIKGGGGCPVTQKLEPPTSQLSLLRLSGETSGVSVLKPVDRPDSGGTRCSRSILLLANHFRVEFDPNRSIYHYDVTVASVKENAGEGSSTAALGTGTNARVSKSDTRLVVKRVFADNPRFFSALQVGYDGEKSMYSPRPLQEGSYTVKISKGTDLREYKCTLKFAAKIDLVHLYKYLERSTTATIENAIQALEVVMREYPANCRIARGRNFYSAAEVTDLGSGVKALNGFFQSLRPTAQGLALNVDFSVMTFYKSIPVIDFLDQNLGLQLNSAPVCMNGYEMRKWEKILKGLKVRVTHRNTNEVTYTIFGLSKRSAREETFDLFDVRGRSSNKNNAGSTTARNPKKATTIEKYFYDQYKVQLKYWYLPCLNLSKKSATYVPMELCVLAEGQRFSIENLSKDALKWLRGLTNINPRVRLDRIMQIVSSHDGPWGGEVAKQFGLSGTANLTEVQGRVLDPPDLKAGQDKRVKLDQNCQWNLLHYQLYDPKAISCWAIISFVPPNRSKSTNQISQFAQALTSRCYDIGISIAQNPLDLRCVDINCLSDQDQLRRLLKDIAAKCNNNLQVLICVIAYKHAGYKVLKLISETEVGIMTQCCLGNNIERPNSQYLANLALKINAKVGGSNVALTSTPKAQCLSKDMHVMFMGADVNHPSPRDKVSPSIAAVVATMNWPAANIYEATIRSQDNRKEKIVNLGDMCIELAQMYHERNRKYAEKVVFFRDGVSEGQFNMVLNEELDVIKEAFASISYNPSITLIVAQKRHRTRLFPADRRDATKQGNVPPGTIVDTKIVHVKEFDFFLCSHYGLLGTSKPTHYHVLLDENVFSSDELQTLVYNLCFTFARCTKPVSLVPPVYYADLVAYRGRLYYDGWLEAHSSSSSSSSSSPFGFDHEMFPKLHRNIKHNMFFG